MTLDLTEDQHHVLVQHLRHALDSDLLPVGPATRPREIGPSEARSTEAPAPTSAAAQRRDGAECRASRGGDGERDSGTPMTLVNAASARVRLVIWCLDCRHGAEPDPAEMAERYGAEMPVPDWQARLICGECGSRRVDRVVSGIER